ncbi:hypothetical protein FQR65_LT01998 [Abscondita terminalis]|nr:hypothetical protein FQR65_LT01998 [Abscondita terminalis]
MTTIVEDEEDVKNKSHLNARVCSILSRNCTYPTNLRNVEESLESKTSVDIKQHDQLQIYLRIKNSQNFENLYQIINDKTLLCKVPKGSQFIRNNQSDHLVTRRFRFSKIFGPETSQSQLFSDIIEDKVINFINGINSTLLTYGVSGSGKTFTVVGTSNKPGIVPRSLELLFSSLPKMSSFPTIKPAHSGILRLSELQSNTENLVTSQLLSETQDINRHREVYRTMQEELRDQQSAIIDDISDLHLSVWISFAEIYNEYIYDLLVPAVKQGQPRKKLRLVFYNKTAYIKDLKYVHVSSASDAYCILQYGLQNLNYAATSINDHSSRSHSIFTIRLAQASDTDEGVSVSAFNFCDLAGSERMKKTNNVGDRLKESNNINTSLMVLGRCISAIRDAQKSNTNQIIPFRDSKFTQLFQNALSGNEAIFMIVNMNPTIEMFDESQHVLNFSALAKQVSIEQQQLIERPKNKIVEHEYEVDTDIEDLRIQVAFLSNEIEQEEINHEDEIEHISQTYKKIIADANQFWQDACRNIRIAIAKNQTGLDLDDTSSDNDSKNDRKRKNISIVIIDSSSDEDSDVEEKINTSIKIKSNKLQKLQDEFRLLKCEYDSNEIGLHNILTKILNTENLIEDAKATYNDFEYQYKELVRPLESKILLQDDEISKLRSHIDSYTSKFVEDVEDI